MPQKLLKYEEVVKKTSYHPREPIPSVFSAIKELLKFDDINGTSCTQYQAVNIVYVVIHRTGRF